MPRPRTGEGRPLWGRAGYTALHGARLSSVSSGDQSANPASVPGRSGLQRALLSVSSAQKSRAPSKRKLYALKLRLRVRRPPA